ncbi:MAG: menaquinone biosynthesis protein [Planctomycetes bacterium]|nr:menaquinone biosynthesis protein [Planctomycetota bacterium]
MAGKVRIGVVSYLNAMPLWIALRHDEDIELVPETPSRLSELMRNGKLDIGLLPVVEALREPALSFFPDLGISADGTVDSVGLFTREELANVKTVALSAASRTSNALARVILNEVGAKPTYEQVDVQPEALADRKEDAVLMIGDACLRGRRAEHDRVFVDLAAEWKILTDLPFVFAVWAGPKALLTPALHKRLRAALRQGRELTYDAIRYAAMDTGWSESELGHYLEEVIIHDLGPQSLKGLLEFARRASALNELPRSAVDKVLDAIKLA